MLNKFTNYIVQNIFGMDMQTKLASSVHFFIYDTLKIIFLLSFMIFTISYIRSYFPPEKVKKIIQQKNGFFAHFIASILGVLSPF